MKITLIGLGNSRGDLTRRAEEALNKATKIIARTGATASFANLQGYEVETLDSVFESSRNFDTLNKNLANAVLEEANKIDV